MRIKNMKVYDLANELAEEIEKSVDISTDKKLVICCSRGKKSVDIAEYL